MTRADWAAATHPAALPPRVRLEDALLEVASAASDPARVVDRRHGLPPAERNHADVSTDGRRRYRDVRYRRWGLVVELDGREAHPDDARFRDRCRDNRVVESGQVALRYGWREVAAMPCAIAGQVARVLSRLGWTGTPRPCGPRCEVAGDGGRTPSG